MATLTQRQSIIFEFPLRHFSIHKLYHSTKILSQKVRYFSGVLHKKSPCVNMGFSYFHPLDSLMIFYVYIIYS